MRARPAASLSASKGKPALGSLLPRLVLLCAALALLFGCNDDKITVTTPIPTVDATLSARVISYPSGASLAGSYRVLGSSVSGTTAADGSFSIEHLSTGNYQIVVDAPGHASTEVTIWVDGTDAPDGRVHLHRDIYLIEKTGSARISLFAGVGGQPARHAVADLQDWSYPDGAGGHRLVDASVPATIEADSAGVISISGFPATGFTLVVHPYDMDGDGVCECTSHAQDLALTPGATTVANITLPAGTGGSYVVYSNLDDPSVPLQEPALILVYSTPMDTSAGMTEVAMWQNGGGGNDMPLLFAWTSPVRLEVSSVMPLDPELMSYNIRVTAKDADGASVEWRMYDFKWLTPGVGGGCAEEVTGFTTYTAELRIDYNTTMMWLQWDALACARGYRIYARDDRDNPHWVEVGSSGNDFEDGMVAALVTLPPSFDRYASDWQQTPFAGIRLTFCIVPARAHDPNPGGAHPTLVLSDNVPPRASIGGTVFHTSQDGVSPDELGFMTVLSEFAAPSQGAPVALVTDGGGDPNYHLDPASMIWSWDQGMYKGTANFVLDPAQDATGDTVEVIFATLSDLSGNDSSDVVTDKYVIRPYDRNFHFESSGDGWIRLGDGWGWGAPHTGPMAAYRGTGCWGTNLSAEYGDNWSTTLTSPEIVVPQMMEPKLRFEVWYDTQPDDILRVELLHGVDVVPLFMPIGGDSGGWTQLWVPLNAFAGERIQIRFTFVSDGANGGPGVFVDDVSVVGD